jgi:hypothetical protein
VYVHFQFYVYRGTFDFLFSRAKGYNVSGIIEPAGRVKRQIIVTGHHDSACVCRYLLKRQRLFPFRVFALLIIFYGTLAVLCWWSVLKLLTWPDYYVSSWFPYAMAAGSGVIFHLYFMYMERTGTPGAGDNLISSTILVQLAELFGGAAGYKALKKTRLILLSTDAEEAGLKGAKAYVKKHQQDILRIPTSVITLECLYHLKDLGFTLSDCNGFVKLSKNLARRFHQTAQDLGYPSRLIHYPFGGGATDAAEFARAGAEATTVLGMATNLVRDGLVYHTPKDTVESIDTALLDAVLSILEKVIVQMDQETV